MPSNPLIKLRYFAVLPLLVLSTLNTAVAQSVTLDGEQWAFLSLINNFRAQNRAGPLQVSVKLQTASQWMSNDLATKNYFSHTDSLGRSPGARLAAFGYTYSPWGENIAAGNDDAQSTFNQWLTACDPDGSGQCTYAHRKNMLYGGYVAIGIGRAYNAGSAYRWYWTTDFGGYLDQAVTPNPGPAPTPTPAPSILLFRATPSTTTAGQPTMLSWNVTGATTINIDNGIGDVSGATSRWVSPSQTTTYTLTATNAGGGSTASTTVTVSTPVCPAPATEAFTGCYYNNVSLTGPPALARTNTQVNLDGSPDPAVSPSSFSVRWQGSFNFAQGDYVFSAITADGMRIYIDGSLVLNAWRDQSATSYTVAQTLSQGQHLVTVEYYQRNGATSAHLSWQRNDVRNGRGQPQPPPPPSGDSQPPTAPTLTSAVANSSTAVDLAWIGSTDNVGVAGYQIYRNGTVVATVTALAFSDTGVSANSTYAYFVKAVDGAGNVSPASNSVQVATPGTPPPAPTPAPATCGAPASNAFTGCYYNNATLAGNPVLTRVDSLINFDWGVRSPDRFISSNGYSVRWQGSFSFGPGDYTFTVITSDGMRVYLDGVLVLDAWRDQSATAYAFTRTLSQGNHLIVVEYYRQSGSASTHLSWQPVGSGGRR